MRRLDAMDALILHQEEIGQNYMHSLRLSILDPSGEPGGYNFHRTKNIISRILEQAPPTRWRLVPTPLNLYHPLWIEDPDFDLDYHVHRVGCPAPGSDRELAELVSRIAGTPLDRSRPLWEVWLVEGLENGCVAHILKVHHALADGVGFARILEDATQTAPKAGMDLPEPAPFRGEPVPPRTTLLRLAVRDLVKDIPAAARAVRRRRREIKATVAPDGDGTQLHHAPPTSLNRFLDRHRQFVFSSFSMSDVKDVRSAFGVTVNDVLLATSAGALRRYLNAGGELPQEALVAAIPISVRSPVEEYAYGNRFNTIAVRLATEIDDPVERLLACSRHAGVAKAEFSRTAGNRVEDYLRLQPPGAHRMLVRVTRSMVGRGRPVMGNVTVSCVPGPPKHLYLGESRFEAFYSIGPVVHGLGLNITAWSYAGQFNVSMLCCRQTVKDLWQVMDLMRCSFDELHKEAKERLAGVASDQAGNSRD